MGGSIVTHLRRLQVHRVAGVLGTVRPRHFRVAAEDSRLVAPALFLSLPSAAIDRGLPSLQGASRAAHLSRFLLPKPIAVVTPRDGFCASLHRSDDRGIDPVNPLV